MTWLSASKLVFTTWLFLHVQLIQPLLVNLTLDGSPPIDFLIDLLVAEIWLLGFDHLFQPEDPLQFGLLKNFSSFIIPRVYL